MTGERKKHGVSTSVENPTLLFGQPRDKNKHVNCFLKTLCGHSQSLKGHGGHRGLVVVDQVKGAFLAWVRQFPFPGSSTAFWQNVGLDSYTHPPAGIYPYLPLRALLVVDDDSGSSSDSCGTILSAAEQ